MAKLTLDEIGIFVKDLKAARTFYTRKVGLKVRASDPKFGYLALGATKGGEDAGLTLWQPVPEWGDLYESSLKQIGTVTGIGFQTSDLKRTAEAMKRKSVKVDVDDESPLFGRLTDPDGNVLFLVQPAKVKLRRAGLSSLAFVTVVSREARKTGEFFKKAFGMRQRHVPGEEGEQDFFMYRLSPKGTGISPFTPSKDMYDNPADYDADMAHLGEDTAIGFLTKDIYAAQDQLMAKGVRFKTKAEKRDWGGIQATFFDPDDNVYSLSEYNL